MIPNLISIIIPCFNDVHYIEQSVISALNQTYSYKEVIVVDDGSNEETKKELKRIESKITKLITQENQGQSTARNVGIREARGEFILVLDSDDFFETNFCDEAINVFLKNPNVKIVTSYVRRISDQQTLDNFYPNGGYLKDFLIANQATGSAMMRKSDIIAVGGYDYQMRQGFEDWEFYIRLLAEGGIAYVIPKFYFNYRVRENSTTSKANKRKYELLKYIYNKHKDLYIANYEFFLDHLLGRIQREELEKIKNTKRLEFKIGTYVLEPLRLLKKFRK